MTRTPPAQDTLLSSHQREYRTALAACSQARKIQYSGPLGSRWWRVARAFEGPECLRPESRSQRAADPKLAGTRDTPYRKYCARRERALLVSAVFHSAIKLAGSLFFPQRQCSNSMVHPSGSLRGCCAPCASHRLHDRHSEYAWGAGGRCPLFALRTRCSPVLNALEALRVF